MMGGFADRLKSQAAAIIRAPDNIFQASLGVPPANVGVVERMVERGRMTRCAAFGDFAFMFS